MTSKLQKSLMKQIQNQNKVVNEAKLNSLPKNNSSVIKDNKTLVKAFRELNRSPKGTIGLRNSEGSIIDIFSVSKYYISGNNATRVLTNVDLSIKEGEIIAILGPSGSGKTTLLNIMSGLDRPTFGDVVIQNVNISTLSNSLLTNFRRNNISFIFQSYNLLPQLSSKDNVEVNRVLQRNKSKRLNLENLFTEMGIKNQMNKSVQNLSGGEQQRVSVARALSKNPSIIFADEPTGALDSVSSKKIIGLFKKVNKKYKTTIIIVTHDETIAEVADSVFYVKDGRVTKK